MSSRVIDVVSHVEQGDRLMSSRVIDIERYVEQGDRHREVRRAG